MSASLDDLIMQVADEAAITTMASPGKAIGATGFNLTSASGWPTSTGFIVAIRTVDNNGNEVAGTYTEWIATLAGTAISLGSDPSPVVGVDQVYASGASTQCYVPVSSTRDNNFVAGFLQDHVNPGGYHSALHDVNSKMWLDQVATASAVNNFKVANAATGNGPILSAEGSDTNIPITISPKGTGALNLSNLYLPYKFSIYRAAGFTGGSGGFAFFTFDSVNFDTNSNYDTGTGLWTVPVTGFYQLYTQLEYQMNSGAGYGLGVVDTTGSIQLSNNTWVSGNSADFGHTAVTGGLFHLTAGHTIAWQSYSSGNVGNVGQGQCYATGYLVSVT